MERDRRNGLAGILRLNRSPFPSISSYICISLLISGIAIGSIINNFRTQPEIKLLLQEEIRNGSLNQSYDAKSLEYLSSLTVVQVVQYIMGNSPLIWVSVNTYFTLLALTVKIIIKYTFKELTRQEEIVVRQGFFSFLMFSVVFLSVVAGAHHSHRVLPWVIWFGIIGFTTILNDVAYQRFKFVSPLSGAARERLSWLCFFLFVFSTVMMIGVIKIHKYLNISHLLFLIVDSSLSFVRSLHGLLRCLSASDRFARRPDFVRHCSYWLDLTVALITDTIQLFNYIHLMFLSPLGFNITCFFFFYHIKNAYGSIMNTLMRHHKHNQIFLHIRSTYPSGKAEEGDLCIVCWELLGESRRLPCGHQFHDWCLMWWLAQDASCPTCRLAVSAPLPSVTAPTGNTTTFRFAGGFGFLRLPSFSIEFSTSTSALGPFLRRQTVPYDDSQLTGMGRQVQEMFPQMALDVIIDDLRISGSTQATIENILEGRVGFLTGLPGEEAEVDLWRTNGAGDGVILDEEDSATEEESTAHHISQSSIIDDSVEYCTPFARAKKEMIARYRRRYIESDKGRDLQEKGY